MTLPNPHPEAVRAVAVWTNGIGNKTASHLNFTRTLADKPKPPKRKPRWHAEPGKTPYAGFDETERKFR